MMSTFRVPTSDPCNPLLQNYKVLKQVGTAGQEMVWKIFDAVRLKDGKEVSLFIFEKKMAEKLHKPKRKEIVTDILRRDVMTMTRIKYPKILRTIDVLQESNDSLAFATEAVKGSLSNMLGIYERKTTQTQERQVEQFLEVEILAGIQQICKALQYLHTAERMVHMNTSPQNIIITRKGLWKLFGFGFVQSSEAGFEGSSVRPWQSKQSKMAQPDLDYMAPEVQLMTSKYVTPLCDVFSVAMVICAVFNDGQSLIQANYSHSNYVKQMDQIIEKIEDISSKLPENWAEVITRMVSRDTRCRPTLQSFITMKCFEDPIIRCLDLMDTQDPIRKGDLFNALPQTLPLFPTKLLYSTILLTLTEQMEDFDSIVFAVPSLVAMVKNATDEEYRSFVQPELQKLYTIQKPIQATIFLLENLDVLMAKAVEEEIKADILPMIFNAMESSNILGQEAALNVLGSLKDYFDDNAIKTVVLQKAKLVFTKASGVKSKVNSLECVEKILDSLDKMTVLEDVLPFLLEVQCTDVDVLMTVVDIYEHLLSDKKFGLSHSLLASKVMPSLIPSTALPGLSIEQFTKLMEVLKDMLDEIERQRLSKMAHEMPDQMEIDKTTIPDLRISRRASSVAAAAAAAAAASAAAEKRKTETPPIKVPMVNVEEKPQSHPTPPKMRAPVVNHFEASDTADILLPPITASRRHSSYQGLEQKEQTALEILYKQRLARKNSPANRLSNFLAPLNLTSSSSSIGAKKSPLRSKKYSASPKRQKRSSSKKKNPSIMVSEPSCNDFKSIKDQLLSSAGLAPSSRRPSSSSMTSMSILDVGQRKLSIGGFSTGRRSSFQGICDQAMQLFGGK